MSETVEIKQLATEFIGRGEVKKCLFTQISKNDHAYLYGVTFPTEDSPLKDGDDKIIWREEPHHYEVFKHKENLMYNMVSYPGSESFGKWAYTTPFLERAYELLKRFETEALEKDKSNG